MVLARRSKVLGSFFSPVAFTPSQYDDLRSSFDKQPAGERALMLAVLQDALLTWYKYANSDVHQDRRRFAEAQSWFFSKERRWRIQLFSFESICETLEFDPDAIRARLRRGTGSVRPRIVKQRATIRRARYLSKIRGPKIRIQKS